MMANHSDDYIDLYKLFYLINLFGAALSIVFGAAMIFASYISVTVLLYVFAAYLIISGVSNSIHVFRIIDDKKKKNHLLFRNGFLVLSGILLMIIPGISAIILFYIIGIWFVVTGLTEMLLSYYYKRRMQYPLFVILVGVLTVLFGIFVILFPKTGTLVLAWIIGIGFIIWGMGTMIYAFIFRKYFLEFKVQ